MATHEVVAVAVATSEAAGAGAVEVSAMEAVPSSSKKRSLPPGAPFPQPRGRPRKDHVWDSMAGEWVPDAEAAANQAAASNGTSMDSGTKAERREARNAKHAAEVDAARRALVMRGVDRRAHGIYTYLIVPSPSHRAPSMASESPYRPVTQRHPPPQAEGPRTQGTAARG